jgi:23S rRNA (cytidine1920-2'-O)/16S rRNA (cytidine1409-2'-O)-methyltransferase
VPRADQLLVHLGLAASRTAAQRLIEAARVRWRAADGLRPVTRASQTLPDGSELLVAADAEADRYVSRGGWKLHGALAATGVSAQGAVCLDVGQSTGGFTDCLLQAGARQVVGVDVGHGQLHPRLREASQVVCIEGLNARHIDRATLGPHLPAAGFALIVGDVSFISLTLVLPRLPALLAPTGSMLLLVKPQFEVGPEHLGKGGIVRDAALYARVEDKLRQCAQDCGLRVRGWLDSPLTGGDGNREFFIWTEHEHT